ncbi:hypothetical protein ABW19_dt0202188 [Dactylella cylindrospora]|nr:hypothetical protein ABW19_dt0202188 [Dactylella cylindrospora]
MSTLYGNCNFRNLEHNTVCGCQEFTPEEDDEAPKGLISTGGRARKTCLCGHFINFHTKPTEERHEPKKPAFAESFRTARPRSGATSPTSIIPLTNTKQTPATEPIQDYEETYTLSKTFEDPIRYQPNQPTRGLTTSFGESANGLGISTRSTRDLERSSGGRSGDSSAVTEIAPPFNYLPGRLHPNLLSEPLRDQRAHFLRSARSSPLLGHQPLHHLNFSRGTVDDATVASTVADSPVVTGREGYLEFSRRVDGALRIVSGLSQNFLPLHLQEGKRIQNPTTARDNTPLIVFDGHEPSDDELERLSLAAESNLRILANALSNRITSGIPDEEPRNRVEELPQSVPNGTPVRPLAAKSSSEKAASSQPGVPSSPPAPTGKEVAISTATTVEPSAMITESFVNRKLHEISEKVDLQEEMCNDVVLFKNTTEEDMAQLNTNVFDLEERLVAVENIINEERSFRKRPREDDESDGERRTERRSRRSKRRRHDVSTIELRTPSSVEKNYTKKIARGSEVNQLPDGTIKQTLTTTTSFTHSTSTSFTSASSSCSASSRRNQTALIKALSSQIGAISQRLQIVESVAAPTMERPWIVQVVVLPRSTWTIYKRTPDGDVIPSITAPRILEKSSRAWKRLQSRGLIKTLEVTGGEARDVERTIRRGFGSIFKTLFEAADSSQQGDNPNEWSPLRKAPEQVTLRSLSANEMNNQLWKVDFLRGTCAEDIGPPIPSPPSSVIPSSDPPGPLRSSQLVRTTQSPRQPSVIKPTHRLYITNCWTTSDDSGWNITRDNTQMSSANSKKRAGSVLSTQPSSAPGTIARRKSRADNRPSLSPKAFEPGYRSGWADIRNLPPESTYIHNDKHEIASMKPRPIEDEAFWYYDAILDGPRDDHSHSGDGSAQDTTLDVATVGTKDDLADDLLAIKLNSRSSGRRKNGSQVSQRVSTQQSINDTTSSSSFQQPPLLSQPSFTGRTAPSLSRNSSRNFGDGDFVRGVEATNTSLGMLSHDSDSTPKARSFVGTPPPNSSFANTRVLRSRRAKESKNTNDDKTPTNSMTENPRPSQSLLRVDSKEGENPGGTRRLSRSSTVEDDPPASLLTNPHNSEETNAELMAKYGHDNSTINKYLEPLTPFSAPLEEERRSGPKE